MQIKFSVFRDKSSANVTRWITYPKGGLQGGCHRELYRDQRESNFMKKTTIILSTLKAARVNSYIFHKDGSKCLSNML